MRKSIIINIISVVSFFILSFFVLSITNAKADDVVSDGAIDITTEVASNGVTSDGAITTDTEDGKEEVLHFPLVINEVIASNTKYNKYRGDFFDIIEIKNVSNEAIYLGDYYISDSKKDLKKRRLPKSYLGAGKVTIIYCIGKDTKIKHQNEAGFGLDSDGEKIYISHEDGTIIDKLKFKDLPVNVSYGLSAKGTEYRYFKKPSFGKANSGGYVDIAEKPAVSVKEGFYNKTVKVKFTNKRKDGYKIYYTTDGSLPTTKSKVYKGGEIVFKNTGSLRAIATKKGYLTSDDVCYSYFIKTPDYKLDTVMVSLKPSDFSTMGVKVTSNTKYPAMVSLYSKGKKKWSENCGIRVHGGASRSFRKKSYKIIFSTKYGAPKLKAKIFDDSDIDTFDSLLLRGGSEGNSRAMMRDELVTSLARKDGVSKGLLAQGYHPVNLYINSQYRGVYYIREAVTASFVADHLGCKKNDVSLVSNFGAVSGKDCAQWRSVYNYARSHDMSNKTHYNYVKKRLDVESVCDFMIFQMWAYNFDENNVKACKGADGKWRIILFDLDLSIENSGRGARNYYFNTAGRPGNYSGLIKSLLRNKEFRTLWNKRAKQLLGKKGVLGDKSTKAQVDKIYNEIKHDMKYNCDYWTKNRDIISHKSFKQWNEQVKTLKKLLSGRASIAYKEIKA